MSTTAAPDGGFTVVYCDGHRCRALRPRSLPTAPDGDAEDLAEVLRQAVRSSRGGVLVRAECLGACHRAPVLLLVSGTSAGRRGTLVGPVEEPQQVDAVVGLIRQADGVRF